MRDENVRVHIYTNAERMDVDRLVKYRNISCICCSVNAATEETYDKVVRGPDCKEVVKNVKAVVQKASCPVYVSMVIVDANKHEADLFRRIWGRNAIFGEFKNWGGDLHDPIEKTGKRYPCWPLMNTMSILWDGRVVPCCMDYDGKVILGDANKQTLTEIWHSSHWMRQRSRRLNFDMIPCRECNHNMI